MDLHVVLSLFFLAAPGLSACASPAPQDPPPPEPAPETPAARPERPPRPGVARADLRIPIERLVPDAVFEIPGVPDWIAIDEHVWISNGPKGTVARLDPKTNTVLAHVPVGPKPCAGLAAGFGSLWVPCCGDGTLVRVDLESGAVQATLKTGVGDSEGSVVVGAGSVWLMTDAKGTLARIDPASNEIVAEIRIAPRSFGIAYGEGAIWVTSSGESLLARVDPATNLVVERIPVGPQPRFLAVGAGSVWTLNQGDGSISRVDPKTNKVSATIEAGIPGGGGEIAVGAGSVWVTSFEHPLTRIDPATDKVVQQFHGPGGDAVRFGHGSVWLSNLRAQDVWRLDPERIAATRAD